MTAQKNIPIYLDAISLVAPGLKGWQKSLPVLSGAAAYRHEELEKFSPSILPANERRRTTQLIKLALQAAESCLQSATSNAAETATVFASSDGDHIINDKICRSLAMPDHLVSPIQFHNSVHNAPAGYWAIAAQAHLNSTSLSACDETFSAGLIDAVSFAIIEKTPVLFVAYDYPAPEPLHSARSIESAFAVAMSLTAIKTENCIATLGINLINESNYSVCGDNGLEAMRTGNPAARSLPLLQAIAKQDLSTIIIPHLNDTALQINLS